MSARTGSSFSKFIERARSEPGLGRSIIAWMVAVVIGTATAGYFLANQRFNPPWENRYSVWATFDQAPGVAPGKGQEVRIAGVDVGDIRSSNVTADGHAQLELRVDDQQKIYSNARFVLRPKSPLNDMYVEISPGGPPGQPLRDGSKVPASQTVRPIQIDEVLAHLDTDARKGLTALLSEADVALANAPSDLPAGLVETDKATADLQPVMEQLEKRRTLLAELMTSLSEIAAATGEDDQRLTRLATSLQETLASVGATDDDLDEALAEMPEFSKELQNASKGVRELVDELDPTLRSLADAEDELPDALSRFNDSVDELDTFLDHAKPVLRDAKPVLADLRVASPHLQSTVADLRPITKDFDPFTEITVRKFDDLNAFFRNTNNVASLRDANRGLVRLLVGASPESIPPDILAVLTETLGGAQ
jgi:phospholipid/cholesterol/gamma-HCH transport system substrate-binding protein